MRALVEKFPDGLQEEGKLVVKDHYDQSNATKHYGEIELDPEIIAGKINNISLRDKKKWKVDLVSQYFHRVPKL